MLKSPTLWILRLLKSVGILLETLEDETPHNLVFALAIFHNYRPEQRIPSFSLPQEHLESTSYPMSHEVLFQTPAPPPTTQQIVVWYANRCIIKLSNWDRSVVLEQKYFHRPVVPNTFWKIVVVRKINSHPGHVTGKFKMLGQKGERKFEIKNKSHLRTLACWWQDPRSGQHIWTKKNLLCRSTRVHNAKESHRLYRYAGLLQS